MIEVTPTVVPQSVGDVVNARERYGAFSSVLHVDIADGVFASNTTWIPGPEEPLLDPENFLYEAHLMMEKPSGLGMRFAHVGARRMVAHTEAFSDANEAYKVFDAWRTEGVREIGLGVLFGTSLQQLEPFVGMCDFVHLMTIATVGTQGIPYAEGAPVRVAECRALYPKTLISVDGGISEENVAKLARAGAQRFCVGSALVNAEDPADVYKKLQTLANSAIQ